MIKGKHTTLEGVVIRDPNDATRLAEFDNKFKSLLALDPPHHEVHEGRAFRVHLTTSNLSANPLTISLTAPASGAKVHLEYHADSHDTGTFTFKEGVSTSGGSSLTAFNRARDSSNTTQVTNLLQGATITGGTVLDQANWGKKEQGGGESRAENEWVLAPGETYSFELTGTVNTPGNIRLDWYEHTDE